MEGEFYFMAIAGLGVSLAGFAGLISALDRRPGGHSPMTAWRIRNVVLLGFAVTFVGFGTVALYTATQGNLRLTVRLASISVILPGLWWLWFESRPGPAWPDERQRRITRVSAVAIIVLALGNVLYGGLGYLQFLMLAMLANPISIFINTVRGITSGGGLEDRSGGPAAANGDHQLDQEKE